jgi:hypothetical protein
MYTLFGTLIKIGAMGKIPTAEKARKDMLEFRKAV